jgi:hypothetical protein
MVEAGKEALPLLAHLERKPLLGIEGRVKQGKRTNNMYGCSIKKHKLKSS